MAIPRTVQLASGGRGDSVNEFMERSHDSRVSKEGAVAFYTGQKKKDLSRLS